MSVWHKTEYKGVRYRKHPTRRHGLHPDRYYVLTYKLDGKTVSEAVGWATEKVKPSECFKLLCELKHNQKTGSGPRTLAEKRELENRQRLKADREAKAEERRNVSFKSFFDDVFFPDAETRWKAETTRKAVEHVENWIHPVTDETPFRDISLSHLKRIRANLSAAGRSARLQQYVFRTFSMVWRAAQDHKLVEVPCPTKSASFRLPKVDNERQRYLTPKEEPTLLAKVKNRSEQAHNMAIVSLDAGLRFGEVAALTWGCVDLEKGVLRVLDTKGGEDRLVPMTERLKALFESMNAGAPGELVFPNRKSAIQTQVPSSFKRGVEDAKLNEGITNPKLRASFHTLRHTFASRLVQAGVDLYRVQRLLGHSTPVMTARYSKLADDDLRDAVHAMEQDGKIRKSEGKIVPMRKKNKAG